ncbi:MAG: flippase, partial [Candidatus Aminicenantales bacterium]
LTGVIQIMSLAIPFNSMFMMLAASFEGFKRVKYRVYTENIFANTTKLFLVIVLGLLGYGVFGIALSHTVAMVLTFFLAFYFLERKLYPALKPKIKPVLMGRELIAFSAPLLFAGFMSTIIMWTDTLMLGYFGSAANVGIYNVALNTAWFLFLLPAALATLFLPVITELHAKGKSKDLESVYKTVTKWIFYFDFPLLLLFMLFPGQILNVIFGSEFVLGYAALGILSLGFFVYNINQTSHHVLSMLKRTDCIFYSTAVCAAVNVVLNFILIPVLGISGAAVASAVTYVVLGALLAVFAWKFAETVPFSKSWIRSFAVGLVSVALITILGRAVFRTFDIYILALLFVLFVLLYAFLLLVSGGVEKEDVEILCTIERKTRLRSERLRSFIKKFVRY